MKELACRIAQWFAAPVAIVIVPLVCVLWLLTGLGIDPLTLALSIIAITTTQLVLLAGRVEQDKAHKRDEAMHAKLDHIIERLPETDDAFAGIEKD